MLNDNMKQKDIWQQNIEVMETFAADYMSIIKLDLETGNTMVLRSERDEEMVGIETAWQEFIKNYIIRQVYEKDRLLAEELTVENIRAYFKEQTSLLPMELRFLKEGTTYDWVKISADKMQGGERNILITIQVVNEAHMMKRIIDLYVYRNFDFFVLINARNNTYSMFNGKKGIPLPPAQGNDYEGEVRRYNKKYVVPEDLEESIENMSISHICKMLEVRESYEFSCGFVNDEGEYRRLRAQFMYYDREAGLILSTRIDVTNLYVDEGEKERKLAKALREAQLDPMTELYNKKVMAELVNGALGSRYRAQAALLFIDIDNFKLVNDTLGHQKGDEVIRYIAHKLARVAGKDGIAGRIGGDEFLLYLPLSQNMERIKGYAQEICNALESKKELNLGKLPVSCSVGISIYPQDGTEYEELLYKADQALYDAKRYGKCRYAFYSSTLSAGKQREKQKKE